MGRGSTKCRQNPFGHFHAAQVFRAGFLTDQNQLEIVVRVPALLSVRRVKHDLSRGSTRPGIDPLCQELVSLYGRCLRCGIENGLQQLIEVVSRNTAFFQSSFGVNQAFVHQIHSNSHCCKPRSLGISSLQHPDLATLNSELNVLNFLVVLLKDASNVVQLLVGGRHVLAQSLFDSKRGTSSCDDVFALSVDQVVTTEARQTDRTVASEAHTSRTVVTEVAEHHGLNINRCTPVVRDTVLTPIDQRPVVHPASEYGTDTAPQLFHRIFRKLHSLVLADHFLELHNDLFQCINSQILFMLNTGMRPCVLKNLFEVVRIVLGFRLQSQHHVAVHLNQTTIAVPCKMLIAGLLNQCLNHLLVDTNVQHGVHHSRHRFT